MVLHLCPAHKAQTPNWTYRNGAPALIPPVGSAPAGTWAMQHGGGNPAEVTQWKLSLGEKIQWSEKWRLREN